MKKQADCNCKWRQLKLCVRHVSAVALLSAFLFFAADGTAQTHKASFLDIGITSPAKEPTDSSPIQVTVTFGENVTDFDSSDVITTNCALSRFNGFGAEYRFGLRPLSLGTIIAEIPAEAAHGGSGNANARALFTRTYVGNVPLSPTLDLDSDGKDVIVYGGATGDKLTKGGAIATGDLNGDGIEDIVLGAWHADRPGSDDLDVGGVYVFFGGSGLQGNKDIAGVAGETPDVTIYGASESDFADYLADDGTLVVGDLNGDGIDDLILGAPLADGPGDARTECGEVYVIYGSAGLPTSIELANGEQDMTFYGATAYDHMGGELRMATGDLNGDGIDDLVLGAPLADGPGDARTECGEVYVIYGSAGLPNTIDLASASPDLIVYGASARDNLAEDALVVGDVNGDGLADLLVGAWHGDGPDDARTECGEVYVVYGSADLPAAIDLASGEQNVTVYGTGPNTRLSLYGTIVLGDINGDQINDIVLGGFDAPDLAGEAHVIYGSANLPATVDLANSEDDLTVYGAASDDWLTAAGAIAVGDVNGDSIGDLILGAPMADGADSTRFLSGGVYIIYGKQDLPDTISLADHEEDVAIHGAKSLDTLTIARGSVGDINSDGIADIVLTASTAGSGDDDRAKSGAAFIVTGSDELPAVIDLAGAGEDTTIWGATTEDQLTDSGAVVLGDVNGDGVNDIILGAYRADGPDEVRLQGGEAYVIFGVSVGPTVTVEQAASQRDPTNTLPILFHVNFSSPVTGFDADDVEMGGTATEVIFEVSGSGANYTISVTSVGGDGTLEPTVPAAVCTNLLGSPNSASTSEDNVVTYDTTPPEVTVEQADGQNDPTGKLPIIFDAVFSEGVVGFSAVDVEMGGTAPGVDFDTPGADAGYRIVASLVGGPGTLVPTIDANVCQDLAGNWNNASTSEDNSVMYDPSNPPLLKVSPEEKLVDSGAGETVFIVDNIGDGVLTWTASESCDWVSLEPRSGTAGSEKMTARYTENTSEESRTCTITVSSPEAANSPVEATLIQAGKAIPFLYVTPPKQEVDGSKGKTFFTVANIGGGEITWTASESCDWVSLEPSGGSGLGSVKMIVDYDENPANVSRTCTIIVSSPEAPNSPVEVTLTQADNTPWLIVSPESVDVGSSEGLTKFDVSNSGVGQITWEASPDCDWVVLSPDGGSDLGGTEMYATYSENPSLEPRTCTITVTSPEAENSPVEVTLIQAGFAPFLVVKPEHQDVGGASGNTAFTVANTGSGAIEWLATETCNWVTLSPFGGSGLGGTSMRVNFTENSSNAPRTCEIKVAAPQAVNEEVVVTVTQAPLDEPVLSVTPSLIEVGALSCASTFTVLNLGGGTIEWTAETQDDWITLSTTGGSNTGEPETVTVFYDANPAATDRAATVTVSAGQATGAPKTVTIIQKGGFLDDFNDESIDSSMWNIGGYQYGDPGIESGTYSWEHVESDDALRVRIQGPQGLEVPGNVDVAFEAYGRTSSGKNWEYAMGRNSRANHEQWDWAANEQTNASTGITSSSVDWALTFSAANNLASWVWGSQEAITWEVDRNNFGFIRVIAQSRPPTKNTPKHSVVVGNLELDGLALERDVVSSDEFPEIDELMLTDAALAGDWTLTGTTTMSYKGKEPKSNQQEFYIKVGGESLPEPAGEVGATAWVQTAYDFNDAICHEINFTWGAQVNAEYIDRYAIQIANNDPSSFDDYQWLSQDTESSKNLYYMEEQGNLSEAQWSLHIDSSENVVRLFNGPDLTGALLATKELDPEQAWHLRFIHSDATSAGFPSTDNSLYLDFFSATMSACYSQRLDADFIGEPVQGKAPLTVEFTDLSSGSPDSWIWDFDGDGEQDSDEQNPTHVYDKAGTYTVSLTVATTPCLGTDTETKLAYIVVSGNVPPTIEITQPGAGDIVRTTTATLAWLAFDADDDAVIAIGYDTDSTGYDGPLIQEGISEDANQSGSIEWNLAGVAPGTYWIYGIIDDGVNPPVGDYSEGTITIPGPAKTVIFYIDQNDNDEYDDGEGTSETIVYVNAGEIGLTDANGAIEVSELQAEDVFFGKKMLSERDAVKGGHQNVDSLLYTTWVDSDTMKTLDGENAPDGSYRHILADDESPQYIEMAHPIFAWNLMVAFDFVPDLETREWWQTTFAEASKLLYDVTDGQMRFGKIHIDYGVATDSEQWAAADIVVRDGDGAPRSNIGAAFRTTGRITLNRTWQGVDVTTEYYGTVFHAVVAREFAQYALGLLDEFVNGRCDENEWTRYRLDNPLEAPLPWAYGIMDGFAHSELSSANDYLAAYPDGAFTDASTVTMQVWGYDIGIDGGAVSCWDHIKRSFSGELLAISPSIDLTLPPEGVFEDGQSTTEDRSGPEPETLFPPFYWVTEISMRVEDTQKNIAALAPKEDSSGGGVNVYLDIMGTAGAITITGSVTFESAPIDSPSYVLSTDSGAVYSDVLTPETETTYSFVQEVGPDEVGALEIAATTEIGNIETYGEFEIDPHLAEGGTGCGYGNPSLPTGSAKIVYTSRSATVPNDETYIWHIAASSVAFNEIADGQSTCTSVSFRYSDEDVAGLDESSLTVFLWSDASTVWELADGQSLSPTANVISADVCDEGLFAVFAVAATDDVPPSAISDLSAETGSSNWTVDLAWTAPGDDGSAGRALAYELRFAQEAITFENWNEAAVYPAIAEPAAAGQPESIELPMPDPDTEYFFAIVARDEAGNVSALSNVASARSFALDTDQDGLPDSYELSHGLDPDVSNADDDEDGDGLTTIEEYRANTNPLEADTDKDGFSDGEEFYANADPLDPNDTPELITDINFSGAVDAADVQLVINAALGIDMPYDADVNRDGQINAVDVQLVINAVLGLT